MAAGNRLLDTPVRCCCVWVSRPACLHQAKEQYQDELLELQEREVRAAELTYLVVFTTCKASIDKMVYCAH